jgi:hypothetical protein
MYRFYLNDELKQYIREEHIEKNSEKVIEDYLEELNYTVNIDLKIGSSQLHLTNLRLFPDWENKCMRCKSVASENLNKDAEYDSQSRIAKMLNFETFQIPFDEFLMENVKVTTVYYGQMIITDTIVRAIINGQDTNGLQGYKYSFIKEAFDDKPLCDYIYKINNHFYEVYYSPAGMYSKDKTHFGDEISLTRVDNGQYCFKTAFELLRGEGYLNRLEQTDDGLYIPNLRIQKYKKV